MARRLPFAGVVLREGTTAVVVLAVGAASLETKRQRRAQMVMVFIVVRWRRKDVVPCRLAEFVSKTFATMRCEFIDSWAQIVVVLTDTERYSTT